MKLVDDSNHQRGFTFIEILVVATIVAVLTSIGAASYQSANQKSRNGKRQADIEQIRSALEMYKADNGIYPTSLGASGFSTYLNPLPSPPANSKCSSITITSYNTSCVYSRPTTTSYTVKIDLEPSGTYSKTNP